MPKAKESERQTATPIGETFEIIEAYKSLRANLLFALANAQKKIVVVSGAEPNVGKSTTSSNLAVMMAQTGSRVLLIASRRCTRPFMSAAATV